MVNGRRRKPARYSVKDLADAIRYRRFADALLLEYFQIPSAILLETLLVHLSLPLYGVLIVKSYIGSNRYIPL